MRILSAIYAVTLLSLPAVASDNTALTSEAKALSQSFAGQLKQHLQRGMKAGGPLAALDVCNVQAPAISQAVGKTAGWKVGRTSLQARNEENRPDRWELATLLEFEKQKALGTDITKMEYSAIINTDKGSVFRYMKAIPTGGICLTCHGDNVQSEVQEKIHALYPADQALGFAVGDIRGAFTLSKQLE